LPNLNLQGLPSSSSGLAETAKGKPDEQKEVNANKKKWGPGARGKKGKK